MFGPFAEPSDLEENDGKIMKIRRFAKPTANTKEIGYFLVNSSLGQLCVNQQLFGPNTIIGPLPDFSIIEVGPRPIFWWRTPEALNFSPRSRRSVVSDTRALRELSADICEACRKAKARGRQRPSITRQRGSYLEEAEVNV